MMTRTGTLAYCAPEIFTQAYYNEKVDIWSAGTVLFTMLSGHIPFEDANVSSLISKITLCEYQFTDPIWKSVSGEAKDLIKFMLEVDPHKRPSASMVLGHKWFKKSFFKS